MKLLNHLGLAVNSHLHLLHLLNSLLIRVVCSLTRLNLIIMHIIAQRPKVLILILMSKTISTPRQPLINIAGPSRKLRVNLLIKLLNWIDA